MPSSAQEPFAQKFHSTLAANYKGFERTPIPMDLFLSAIGKDKKNVDNQLVLILPDQTGRIVKTAIPNDSQFAQACEDYLLRDRVR